jgi:hypothetical protein
MIICRGVNFENEKNNYKIRSMKGICKLTLKKCELRNSHIYPKFVIEWMKSTGSKYQRGFLTPNKRDQDGLKKYMLSEQVEQLFGTREKWFAENIFHPYLKNRFAQMHYNEDLYYFALSMLWRILVLELEQPEIEKFLFYSEMVKAEKQWREFLLNGIFPRDFNNAHFILTDKVSDHTLPSHSVDYFFTRVLDGTTVYNDEFGYCSIYVKFSRFIFWSFLIGGDEENMINTKINPISGKIGIPQKFDSFQILSFFPHRIKLLDEMEFASEKHQDKIINEMSKNKDHYLNSELLHSIDFDYKMKEKNKNNKW